MNKHVSAHISVLSSLIFGSALTMGDSTYGNKELTRFLAAFVNSTLILGALLGAILAPVISRSLKYTIILANLFYFLGNLLMHFSKLSVSLILARTMIGFGAGIICTAVPVYLSMLKSEKYADLLAFFHQIGSVTGILLGQIIHFIADYDYNDNISFYYTIFVGLVLITSFALKNIRSDSKKYDITNLTRNHVERQKLFTCIILHVLQQISGINGVIMYSHEIFEEIEYINPKLTTIYSGIVSLFFTICSLFFVDIFKDKKILISSSCIVVFSLVMLALNFFVIPNIFLFIAGFNLGLGPVPWIYVSKIFNNTTKRAGVGITVAINWFSAFVITLIFPYMITCKLLCYLSFALATTGLTFISIKRM